MKISKLRWWAKYVPDWLVYRLGLYRHLMVRRDATSEEEELYRIPDEKKKAMYKAIEDYKNKLRQNKQDQPDG